MPQSRNRTVIRIPAIVPPNHRDIAIYCRVSTLYEVQEESLRNQKFGLTEVINRNPDWSLVRTYEDRDSGGNTFRPGFQHMISDAYEHDFDIILVKSISRFSRNTVDLLESVNKLRLLGIVVHFIEDNITSDDLENDFLIAVKSAFAQAESQSISDNIKWSFRHSFERGESKFYRRTCFGYKHDEYGELIRDEDQAAVVLMIYDWYLKGYSIDRIIKELAGINVKSPTGCDKWPKRTIQNMLVNEKYIGNVLLGKTCTGEFPNNKQRKNHGQ